MTDLSIIIINRNNSAMLKDCVDSIIVNTKKISYEIIIVDNASSDDSVRLARRNYPQAVVIENKENFGFSKANNMWLKIAKGRYSMILNNDTKIIGPTFDMLVEYMDAHPDVGAIGPKLLNIDGSIQRQGSMLALSTLRSNDPREVDFIMGACLMVRKETVEQVGLMDEGLLFYNDDLDWCRSIRKAGWKMVFYPAASIIHYGGYSSRRTFNRKLFIEGFRGGLYFCKKHYNPVLYLVYRLFLPLALLILFLAWTVAWPFTSKDKRKEYPGKITSLLEILNIDILGDLTPPVSL